MKVIKRNGQEVTFDKDKIFYALVKANKSVQIGEHLSNTEIQRITNNVTKICESWNRAVHVEEIQDLVEEALMKNGNWKLAKNYITYRYEHELMRKKNTTDEKILSLLQNINEEITQENSNKNPTLNSVMRDYMAGEVSKDISRRFLLSEDIVKAHDEGIIHFHDADYFAQSMYNCCLCNLDDMLQNGTVISGTMIEKPHSFHTACNIATQIIAQVCSNQYGGQTISLAHLAKFVDISRKQIRKDVEEEFNLIKKGDYCTEKFTNEFDKWKEFVINKNTEKRLYKEIQRGVQTLQYQIITLHTTNG